MPRPNLTRVPAYFHNYINQIEEDDFRLVLKNQLTSFLQFLKNIPENKRNFRYAEGKWSIKEVLQHIIDTERIFTYRALCIARKDATPLPGFDENEYAANAYVESRDWENMVAEFQAVRQSTIFLFDSFNEEQLEATGITNGNSVYVLGIGFITAGHITHHQKIISERYL